ncbi:hypothetical protein KCU85_g7623, partial [Aureobasidium melanogenum]
MVNITASLMTLLAVASFAAAAPAPIQPQSEVPTNILEERAVSCRDDGPKGWKRGSSADAARCITELAALGSQDCTASVSGTLFKKCGDTIIHGQNVCAPSEGLTATATCQEAARGAGLIMDQCSRGDGTVMGENHAWASRCLLIHILADSPSNMARTKRKPIQLTTPPRARPLWFEGLSTRDIDHLTYLIESGMDKNRVKIEPNTAAHAELSMTSSQTGSGHEDVAAAIQNSTNTHELPHKQEEIDEEGHTVDENDVPTFDFGTASPAVEEPPTTARVFLKCRRCQSTFARHHQLVAHFWEAHLKQENVDWLPGPVHSRQEEIVQELIGCFVDYESSAGLSPPVLTQPSPPQGPPAAARIPFSRPLPSSARSQSSMMSVFTIDNHATTSGSPGNNARRLLAPARPAQPTLPQPAMPSATPVSAAAAQAFPPGALEPDQPFRLGQPAPLGIKLPTNRSMTTFKWEVYKRRGGSSAFNWTDKKDIKLANRWRSRVSQATFRGLGIRLDRRKKSAAVADVDDDEETEDDEAQAEQGGGEMDIREE